MTDPKNKETYEDVVKVLIERGWKRNDSRFKIKGEEEYWYKRHLGVPRCLGNSDKDGMQVVIWVYAHQGYKGYEIELTGQKSDLAWVKLLAYAWGSDVGLLEVMDSQISQLLAGWTVLAKGNPV